jgi:hypothetical protein
VRGDVYRHGATYWMQYYIDGRRKRESTGQVTKREAERVLNEHLARLGRGVEDLPRLDRVTYQEAAADLRTHMRRLARATWPRPERASSTSTPSLLTGGSRPSVATPSRTTSPHDKRRAPRTARSTGSSVCLGASYGWPTKGRNSTDCR